MKLMAKLGIPHSATSRRRGQESKSHCKLATPYLTIYLGLLTAFSVQLHLMTEFSGVPAYTPNIRSPDSQRPHRDSRLRQFSAQLPPSAQQAQSDDRCDFRRTSEVCSALQAGFRDAERRQRATLRPFLAPPRCFQGLGGTLGLAKGQEPHGRRCLAYCSIRAARMR